MSAVWDTDYLWRGVQGAKLASLFGLDRAESQGNESFQFTAPKQPKKSCAILGPPSQKPVTPPCAPAVLFATAVHAFSFVNGQYVKQGKIGAAVLGNHVTKEYKILLYGSKQKQITTARIHRGFVLTVQPCNYVTFYDDQQQNWSVMFDSEKSRPEFCKEVCVAWWNSEALSDSLVTQDLVQGEGQAVNIGDTVEVAYSGWLLQNHALGQTRVTLRTKTMHTVLIGRMIELLHKCYEFGGDISFRSGVALPLSNILAPLCDGFQRHKTLEPAADGLGVMGDFVLLITVAPPSGRLGRALLEIYKCESSVSLFFQVFDSNLGKEKLQRVKLGAGKALRGWEDGMLGMQKGGRRLLIVPPSMGYGSKGIANHVPANSTLVFDVEIHRVKFSKNRLSRGSVDTFSTSPSTCSDSQSEENTSQLVTDTDETKDQSPKGKVESECLTTSGASKAKLISRIAKIGKPMLSFLTGAIPDQPDPSDSETENTSGPIYDPSPSYSPFPEPAQMASISPSHMLLYQPDDAQKQEAVPPEPDINTTQGFQLDSFTSIYPSQQIPYQAPDIASLLMSDARQHNAEILLAIEKLARRMDQLTCKVDELQKEGHYSFRLSSVSLETNMMLHNIQRIIQESMCLKKEVLEEQNCKIGELSEQNKRYMEQQHNQTCQLQSKQEKVHLSGELGSSTTQANQQQQEVLNLQQRATDIEAELRAALEDKHIHCAQISLLEEQVEELVKQGEQSEHWWRTEKQKCKETEAIIQNMEEMQNLRAEKKNLDQTGKGIGRQSGSLDLKLKLVYLMQVTRVMNGVFQSLRTEFNSQESYSGHTVLEILQNTIKNLGSLNQTYVDEDKVEEEYLSTEECLQMENMQKENNEMVGKSQH
ncbi:FK506-binding protein 15 [Labeo rohita]|uniref:peptidylprolyl isomerase n=1 Tax=Labeo rohita TaxID=84645 RepID=A0ABQ8MQH0_LABRO|nr:FK506-binding protein 15 [Labeo rohita]